MFSMIIWWIYSIFPTRVITDQAYYNDVADAYCSAYLKQYACHSIRNEDETSTTIYFYLKADKQFSILPYSADACAEDVIKIRQIISNYLIEHPSSQIGAHKISVAFERREKGEWFYLCNYDYDANELYAQPGAFAYLDYIDVKHLSVVKKMNDLRHICIRAEIVDELDFFEEWTSLEYLELYTSDMTEEQKSYLQKILPDCEIIVNDEILQQVED